MRRHSYSLLVVTYCLACTGARAQSPVDAWQVVELPLHQAGRFQLVLHSQYRTSLRTGSFFHARGGPIARWAVTPRWTVFGAYYFTEFREPENPERLPRYWEAQQRYFGGLSGRAFQTARTQLLSRTMAEHRFGGPLPSQFIAREMLTYSLRRPHTPFGTVELFFDQRGFMAHRYIGGYRTALGRTAVLEISYVADKRVERLGGMRHIVWTTVRFNEPLWKRRR